MHERVYLLSIVLLAYIAGALMYASHSFPYLYVRSAFIGTCALYEKYFLLWERGPYSKDLWKNTTNSKMGVTIYDRAKTYDGLTLYTSGHKQAAFLISMDGRLVHEWSLPFSTAWPRAPHIRHPIDDRYIYWRMAHLFPNGDLLAIYVADGDTPHGYGLIKLDKDSNVIWKYSERVHHDLDVGEDGRIYALIHAIRNEAVPGVLHIRPPFMEDFLVILSPSGKELQRISILEAIRDSELPNLLAFIPGDRVDGDILHANAVDVVDPAIAERQAIAKSGQVLISMRRIDTIAVLDPEQRRITWAYKGPWRAQHDAHFLKNGHIQIFDNLGHLGRGGRSRVMEFDPATKKVYWIYTGEGKATFYSKVRSRAQRLPNGNTLITESDAGRLFEVTPDNEIVWQYLSPHRGGEDGQLVAVISGGLRIDPHRLTFLDQQERHIAYQEE